MKNIIIAVVVIVLLGGGYLYFMKDASAPAKVPSTETSTEVTSGETSMPVPAPGSEGVIEMEATTSPADSGASAAAAVPEVKTFTVDGTADMKFAPNKLSVKKGDVVRIVFKNTGGFHDFVIDEFKGAKTKQIAAGKEETIEFKVDKVGDFEYYCSVGQHRANGMKGTLTVTE